MFRFLFSNSGTEKNFIRNTVIIDNNKRKRIYVSKKGCAQVSFVYFFIFGVVFSLMRASSEQNRWSYFFFCEMKCYAISADFFFFLVQKESIKRIRKNLFSMVE